MPAAAAEAATRRRAALSAAHGRHARQLALRAARVQLEQRHVPALAAQRLGAHGWHRPPRCDPRDDEARPSVRAADEPHRRRVQKRAVALAAHARPLLVQRERQRAHEARGNGEGESCADVHGAASTTAINLHCDDGVQMTQAGIVREEGPWHADARQQGQHAHAMPSLWHGRAADIAETTKMTLSSRVQNSPRFPSLAHDKMASNPFDCNQKKSAFGSPAKAKAVIPRESVMLVADKNQIITAIVPYNSPQAAAIRQHMHSNITVDGQRVFIFRPVNGWTNIALNSTAESPKLTADPITVLKLAHTKFSECPSVSSVSIKWAGSEDVLTYEDIDHMETMFNPLPESQAPVAEGQAKTEGEFLMDKLNELDKKVDDKLDAIDVKMAYLNNVLGRIAEATTKDAGVNSTDTPATESNRGKKRKESGSSSTSA